MKIGAFIRVMIETKVTPVMLAYAASYLMPIGST